MPPICPSLRCGRTVRPPQSGRATLRVAARYFRGSGWKSMCQSVLPAYDNHWPLRMVDVRWAARGAPPRQGWMRPIASEMAFATAFRAFSAPSSKAAVFRRRPPGAAARLSVATMRSDSSSSLRRGRDRRPPPRGPAPPRPPRAWRAAASARRNPDLVGPFELDSVGLPAVGERDELFGVQRPATRPRVANEERDVAEAARAIQHQGVAVEGHLPDLAAQNHRVRGRRFRRRSRRLRSGVRRRWNGRRNGRRDLRDRWFDVRRRWQRRCLTHRGGWRRLIRRRRFGATNRERRRPTTTQLWPRQRPRPRPCSRRQPRYPVRERFIAVATYNARKCAVSISAPLDRPSITTRTYKKE